MLILQSKSNTLYKKTITFLRKNPTPKSNLFIYCSLISRQPEGPVFFCPQFCFSRIQSSLKCISYMTHFTLMVLKTDNFLSNVSGHLDVQGGAYVSWTDWGPTWLQCSAECFATSAAAGSPGKKETHLIFRGVFGGYFCRKRYPLRNQISIDAYGVQ